MGTSGSPGSGQRVLVPEPKARGSAVEPLPRASRRWRWPRVLGGLAAVTLLAAAGGAAWIGARLHASLPLLDGQRTLPGLSAPVRIERDRLGVPVVRGQNRLDLARATGFLHAQERFFQMDLLRRRAAGELAELVGRPALARDREVRVLRLRNVARRALASLSPAERSLLDAYAGGVAAGLAALGARPFEYLALRAEPAPWKPEDTLLCALAMALTLEAEIPAKESSLGVMHDVLPKAVFEFLAPRGTEWDAPLEGGPLPAPPLPGPEALDLAHTPGAPAAPPADVPVARSGWGVEEGDAVVAGSNNWAVAGPQTRDGGAILANDMHLGLGVPNVWYRASLVFQEHGEERRISGATLPGAPFVVAGSNRRLAWGFTNSEGDWADLVVLEPGAGDSRSYRTPAGLRRFTRATERIRVKGGRDEPLDVLETVWGPVVDTDHRGRRRALAWVALREGGLDLGLMRLEDAESVAEAQAIAPSVGMPHQNLVTADAAGRIGWTLIGRIPRRFGQDGRLPSSWADGTRGWDGWISVAETPRVLDPPSGRVFSANARIVDGAKLRLIGFGGYDLGARQGQIRDDLAAVSRASEADMLRIQLDDRALFLARWQRLLLEVLTPEAVAGDPRRAEALRLVLGWGEQASVGSAGYRIVRAFRNRVAEDAFAPMLARCQAVDPRFDYLGRKGPGQWEGPLWRLVHERPRHLLSPRFESWPALLLGSLDAVLEELTSRGAHLDARTWGERNTTLVRHPLSSAAPWLARLLDMKPLPLPGDSHMPRVQGPSFGASERFAVSPGREERGYFHMPAGQSGHPLSPHYRDGHLAWADGDTTPFLPGPAVDILTLLPGTASGE